MADGKMGKERVASWNPTAARRKPFSGKFRNREFQRQVLDLGGGVRSEAWRTAMEAPVEPRGKIVLHEGVRAREVDGAFVLGEFRPDEGEPIPITVKLVREGTSGPQRGAANSAVNRRRPDRTRLLENGP